MLLMQNKYECHITTFTSSAEVATEVAKELHWKTSEIARDPVLGNDTYFYLTSHSDSYDRMWERMVEAVNLLELKGCKVVREKIEHIVYDRRY
jgi:hypothetical protein